MAGQCDDDKINMGCVDSDIHALANVLISDELQELTGAARSVWVEADDPQGEQLLPPDLQKALARLGDALKPFDAVMV